NFILPKQRRSEVINFVAEGLDDLSITRTTFDWGVKLPESLRKKDSKEHVMYVWLDALVNYLSALGYENSMPNLMDFWPANYHIVGKDILRFHAIYWPAFLMSLGLPLPRHIAAHGWWTKDGAKMSKSVGNVVNPKEVVDAYGIDAFRYFVLREVPFGQDGDFSQNALIERINADLSNDLGNLLNRLLGMSAKYFDNSLKACENLESDFKDAFLQMDSTFMLLESLMESVRIHRYLEELWKLFSFANGLIARVEPWKLIKDGKKDCVANLLVFLANLLIKSALFLSPCMPKSSESILSVFSLEANYDTFKKFILEKFIIKDISIKPISALFPRVENKRLEDSSSLKDSKDSKDSTKEQKLESLEIQNAISKDDFLKIEIKVGTILAAEILPKSEKLLKLKVDLGESRPRQILAGIKAYYQAESLVGKQVCVLANLKPTKLMGEISEGMILAARDDNGLSLITPDLNRVVGTQIS
ncbi:MAG: methionine--tRNA ligase subunit beta, partial [Helicobacter sp.]|nr:methionine--tRNA ligase subunit beta [Helicobacter sp.]